jgi:hypothetical protein
MGADGRRDVAANLMKARAMAERWDEDADRCAPAA